MFDFLKNNEKQPGDVKAIRYELILFIKEQLKKAEGGEGRVIRGLQLYIAAAAERHLYEAALYISEPQRFKDEEIQRIAEDYAIDMPDNWTMELFFVAELPSEAIKAPRMPVALSIITKLNNKEVRPGYAAISILNGEAEQEVYRITPVSGRIYIGRDKKVQAAGGFLRENTIAFPSSSADESNRFVSRQHAHIEWNNEAACYCLYADEGGIPPRNKVKVQRSNGDQIRLQTTEIAHHLEPGDKIVLGESVLLEFDYIREET